MTKTALSFISVGLLAAATLVLTSTHAADEAPALKNHLRTGKYEHCLTNHRINDIRILNDHQILFSMTGGEAYLAEPKHCSGLSKGLALAYDATLDELCNTTIVHLVDPSSPVPQRGTCGIDRFEKLKQKSK